MFESNVEKDDDRSPGLSDNQTYYVIIGLGLNRSSFGSICMYRWGGWKQDGKSKSFDRRIKSSNLQKYKFTVFAITRTHRTKIILQVIGNKWSRIISKEATLNGNMSILIVHSYLCCKSIKKSSYGLRFGFSSERGLYGRKKAHLRKRRMFLFSLHRLSDKRVWYFSFYGCSHAVFWTYLNDSSCRESKCMELSFLIWIFYMKSRSVNLGKYIPWSSLFFNAMAANTYNKSNITTDEWL